MAHELENAKAVRRIHKGALYACRFRRGTLDVVVAWNASSAGGEIRLQGKLAHAVDMVGGNLDTRKAVSTLKGKRVWHFPLSPDPVYLIGGFAGAIELLPGTGQ